MLCDVLAFAKEYCWVMDADALAVGAVTVTVKPHAAEISVVRRDATVVARQSPETPTDERLMAP
jgi:hypothetical protein